jgi:hypothetical protein
MPASEALPCVICGAQLERIDNMSDESCPYKGTNFTTHGHYGSTVFDPMDGSFITLNICDPCLTRAGEQGRVVAGRDSRPVKCDVQVAPDRWMECNVGHERISDSGLVPWTKDLATFDDDVCRIGLDDIEAGLPKNIFIRVDVDQLAADLRARTY